MADQLQLRGDSQTNTDSFVGARREVTVDITTWNLRVHDGQTPGGHQVMKKTDYENGYAVLHAAKAAKANPSLTGTVSINNLVFPNNDGTAGQALLTDGAGNLSFGDYVPNGGSTIIAPFAHAFIDTNNAGTGTGCTWGGYNSSNGLMSISFDTAQPDDDYTVVTDREHYDSHMMLITSKTVNGFSLEWADNTGTTPLSPSLFPGAFLCYSSDPTVSIYGGGGNSGNSGDATSFTWNDHLIPDTDDAYDIGSSTKSIRKLYIQDDAIHFSGGNTLGITNGKITYNGTELTATFAELNTLNNRIQAIENASFLMFE